MSETGKRLRRHYQGKRTRVVVAEWADLIALDSRGDPAVYAKPFTLADQAKIRDYLESDNPEGYARVLIDKAESEDGERLFDITDLDVLNELVAASTITAVAQEIIASVSLEDARGNSQATRSSGGVSEWPTEQDSALRRSSA